MDITTQASGASVLCSVEGGAVDPGLQFANIVLQVKPGGAGSALPVITTGFSYFVLNAPQNILLEASAVRQLEPVDAFGTGVGCAGRVEGQTVVQAAHFAVALGIDVVVLIGRASGAGICSVVLGQAVHGSVGNTVFVYIQEEDIGSISGCDGVQTRLAFVGVGFVGVAVPDSVGFAVVATFEVSAFAGGALVGLVVLDCAVEERDGQTVGGNQFVASEAVCANIGGVGPALDERFAVPGSQGLAVDLGRGPGRNRVVHGGAGGTVIGIRVEGQAVPGGVPKAIRTTRVKSIVARGAGIRSQIHGLTRFLGVRRAGVVFLEVPGSADVAVIGVGHELKASHRDLGDALPPVQREVEVVGASGAVELDTVFVGEVCMGGVGAGHILRTMGNVGEALQLVVGQLEGGQTIHAVVAGLGGLLAELDVHGLVPHSAEALVEVELLVVAFQTVLG